MKHFDYSRGLKAPYSIQVIKSPKGKIMWVFSQPIGLSYFLIMIFGWIFLFSVSRMVKLPVFWGIDPNLMIFIYVPHRFARWYTETELDGKKGIVYVKDFLIYVKDFIFDSRKIYRFERVDKGQRFSFKR